MGTGCGFREANSSTQREHQRFLMGRRQRRPDFPYHHVRKSAAAQLRQFSKNPLNYLLPSLHYTPREEYRCTVTLMSGLPGSGKDTWLALDRPGLPVVSLEELRADLVIGSFLYH